MGAAARRGHTHSPHSRLSSAECRESHALGARGGSLTSTPAGSPQSGSRQDGWQAAGPVPGPDSCEPTTTDGARTRGPATVCQMHTAPSVPAKGAGSEHQRGNQLEQGASGPSCLKGPQGQSPGTGSWTLSNQREPGKPEGPPQVRSVWDRLWMDVTSARLSIHRDHGGTRNSTQDLTAHVLLERHRLSFIKIHCRPNAPTSCTERFYN